MKYIVRKAYWDYEKEEKWLNEMSAKGLVLTDYSWCRYVFEEAPQNKYIYRIELLENLPTHAESIAYIKFLEENGIECIATYMRWIYLRKKSSEGEFDIYSDMDSKIKHFKRVNTLWTSLMWLEFMAGFFNLFVGTMNLNINNRSINSNIGIVNIILGIFTISLGILFWKLRLPIKSKIKKLQQEKLVRE